jgi:hypothetical protein
MVADDIDLAAASATDRLGRLIGPMGVRFVLVPVGPAPSADGSVTAPPPDGSGAVPGHAALIDSLDRQLDLRRVELGDESLVAYENTAWLPVRAAASGAAAEASRQAGAEALIRSDYSDAVPVLPGPLPTEGAGLVAGEAVLLSEAVDERWELTVDGEVLPRRTAFGWATAWDLPSDLGVGTGGEATLRYRTAATRYAIVAAQVLLGLLALLLIRTWRHGPPFGRWMARRRVAGSSATTVIDLTAEPQEVATRDRATAAAGAPILEPTDRTT